MEWAPAQILFSAVIGLLVGLALARFNQHSAAKEALKAERLKVYVRVIQFVNTMPVIWSQREKKSAEEIQAVMDDLSRITSDLALVASAEVALAWRKVDTILLGKKGIDYDTAKALIAAPERELLKAMRKDLGLDALDEDTMASVVH